MASEGKYEYHKHQDGTVLILVLVEDGFRGHISLMRRGHGKS